MASGESQNLDQARVEPIRGELSPIPFAYKRLDLFTAIVNFGESRAAIAAFSAASCGRNDSSLGTRGKEKSAKDCSLLEQIKATWRAGVFA